MRKRVEEKRSIQRQGVRTVENATGGGGDEREEKKRGIFFLKLNRVCCCRCKSSKLAAKLIAQAKLAYLSENRCHESDLSIFHFQ